MNRLKRMKKRLWKYRFLVLLLLMLAAGLFYDALNVEYEKLTPNNITNERYRSVNIVSVGEEYENETNEHIVHALTDNNEIIIIFSRDKDKISVLKNASEKNIIEVKGKIEKILNEDIENLKNQYKDWDSYIYEYALERQNWLDIIFDRLIYDIRVFAMIIIFISSFFRKYINCRKTVKFLKESEDTGLTNYNEGLATFEINNVEIVDNLLIDFKYESFVDLSLYNYFKIYKEQNWVFTKTVIRFFSESGHAKSIYLSIKDDGIEMLKDYLYSIGKYEID
ncbi:hypothetical protein [Oceanivirga salmonicida]|uniref:hypothetical protein n=1 Tax=Oceanivirga salmonicida TaxID=1769291 RepID=UPI0008301FBD|nr:hypothetical protein [Oceanivirga salmonicida]